MLAAEDTALAARRMAKKRHPETPETPPDVAAMSPKKFAAHKAKLLAIAAADLAFLIGPAPENCPPPRERNFPAPFTP